VYSKRILRGLDRIPVAQAAGTGTKIEWLRENTTTEDAVQEIGIGGQLTWSDDVEYTEVESELHSVYIQRKLDHFVKGIYSTYNDYQAQVLLEAEKGLKRRINDRLVYADNTYGGTPAQWDGFHALVAERGTPNAAATTTYSDLNFDMETGALSLASLRRVIDAMKYGVDEILVPFNIGRHIDAAYEEKGFAGLAYNVASSLALLTRGYSEIGAPILFFSGIPIIRTDYLVAEQDGTGTGASSNARAKNTSSTKTYSIFLAKYGNVLAKEPGVCFGFGNTEGAGDLYKLVTFDELEDFDAGGMRLVTYGTVLLGSTMGLARIFDITDAAIVV